MSKEIYVGVGGTARKVPKFYVGVSGTARKVKKGYIGVNGVARLFYDGGKPTLPSAYQLLEYIEGGSVSSGITVYRFKDITVTAMPASHEEAIAIDSGIRTSNYYTDVVSIKMLPESDAVSFTCGTPTVTSSVNYNEKIIVVSNIMKKTEMYLGTDYKSGVTVGNLNNVARVDKTTETFSAKSFNPSASDISKNVIRIGGSNTRLYKCIIHAMGNSGDTVYEHTFWPCRKKVTGEIGMLDTYNDSFIVSYGATAGPEII